MLVLLLTEDMTYPFKNICLRSNWDLLSLFPVELSDIGPGRVIFSSSRTLGGGIQFREALFMSITRKAKKQIDELLCIYCFEG